MNEKASPVVSNEPRNPKIGVNPSSAFTQQLKQAATDLGFVLCGVTAAAAPRRLEALNRWLDAGYAGQMDYIENRRRAYEHPHQILNGCRYILMLALPYVAEQTPPDPTRAVGKVARYALGELDYHSVIRSRLEVLIQWIRKAYPDALLRGVVDTAPLLEREFAEAAGVGWIGKNTLLLNRSWGSYFFLAALLTDLELQPDPPQEKGYCGTCTACLDACPTNAFPEPFVLDARKCISYLTIEHRTPIDDELRDQLHGWVFGCDICQEVCPWNRKARRSTEGVFVPRDDLAHFEIPAVLRLSDDEFRKHFRHTPLWRSKRRGILRNAILVVGGSKMKDTYPDICRLLADEEPLIRGAAAWAVSQFDFSNWPQLLRERRAIEKNPEVLRAIAEALRDGSAAQPDADHPPTAVLPIED